MASENFTGRGSRLSQMQMHFQQKQQEMRDQKRTEILKRSVVETVSEPNVPQQAVRNGKVRQLFDERRRGAGIDRSNPLKPIVKSPNTAVAGAATKRATGAAAAAGVNGATGRLAAGGGVNRRANPPIQNGVATSRNLNNTRSEILETTRTPYPYLRRKSMQRSQDDLDNGNVAAMTNLSLTNRDVRNNNTAAANDVIRERQRTPVPRDRSPFYNRFASPRSPRSPRDQSPVFATARDFSPVQQMRSDTIKLNPVVTRKTPAVGNARAAGGPVRSSVVANTKKAAAAVEPAKSSATRQNQATAGRKPTNNSKMSTSSNQNTSGNIGTCSYCKRNFVMDRLQKHEAICLKVKNSKRKVFDASKVRVRGTEAEKFVAKKPAAKSTANSSRASYSSNAAKTGLRASPNSGQNKSNWRKKHEEFIAAIRAAKEVQAHLKRGGKLSDLPPPPPSENPDYIQCPHCMRRFNQAAAERHIPKCATMLHNKPKPKTVTPAAKRGGK